MQKCQFLFCAAVLKAKPIEKILKIINSNLLENSFKAWHFLAKFCVIDWIEFWLKISLSSLFFKTNCKSNLLTPNNNILWNKNCKIHYLKKFVLLASPRCLQSKHPYYKWLVIFKIAGNILWLYDWHVINIVCIFSDRNRDNCHVILFLVSPTTLYNTLPLF